MGRRPFFLSQEASLPEVVVLPEPCSPAMSTTEGGCEANLSFAVSLPEQFDEFVANDLDDLLGRRERGHDFLADGFVANVVDQFLDDLEVDIGLKQGQDGFRAGLR